MVKTLCGVAVLFLLGKFVSLLVCTSLVATEMYTTPKMVRELPAQVSEVDWLEEGEPCAFAPVTEKTVGPKAGDVINIPGVGDVLCQEHAEIRHGEGAVRARAVSMSGGGDKYDCGDGRIRIVRNLGVKITAIMIVENGREVSAFMSERSWTSLLNLLKRDGCSGPPGAVAE